MEEHLPEEAGAPGRRRGPSSLLLLRLALIQRNKLPRLKDHQFQVRQFPTLESVRGLPDALGILEPLLHAYTEDLKRLFSLAGNLVPPDARPDASGAELLYGFILPP